MSTIASLLSLIDPSAIKPWSEGMESVRREEFGRQRNETGLIDLANLKAKQAAEAAVFEQIKNDPEVRRRLFGDGGGPVLGSLQQPQGQAGAGPITQSPLGGGPSQQIPAYPDASRYAGVSPQGGGPLPAGVGMPTVTPPQSTIASLGPAGQPPGQMQPPRNPLLEMARTDPRAAMMLQQQMQGAQDRQWKLQEQQLDMGVKVAEYVARELQGVTDQASTDAARARVQQVHPQAAAQIPQMYSKEAIESLQQKGIAVANLAAWRKDMATANRTELMTKRLPETLQRMSDFVTGGGTQARTGEAAPTTAAPTTGQQARTAPPEYESAISEANRLYPQVKPERIKSIIAAESNFDAKAVSPAGAKGPMQLMDGTAKDMGVDDPFNVQQNVRGGTRYYAQMLTKYGGDERKALAAYNWGPGNLDKVNGDVSKAPAETQAYVQKVLGGGAQAGSGTSTAQAPPTDPRIAQLEARIKKGQALVLEVANQPGMEGQAALLNQQVNDLQKERDRLDAPRQEFLKKQAVHDLELQQQRQQGADAAQLKADTDPASKEEIDAVNRGLPPDKRVPYGTTRKQLREQGRVGGELLSPKVTEDLTNTTTAIQQFEELNNAVAQLPTGPLTQYVEGFKERWGIDISDAKVAQRAILAGATNQLLQARSGAAINESEYQRLLKELPNESNDPKVFKARLTNTVRQFKNLYKTKVQILRKTGHAIPDDLMEPLPAPEGPPPKPTASSPVDNFRNAVKPPK